MKLEYDHLVRIMKKYKGLILGLVLTVGLMFGLGIFVLSFALYNLGIFTVNKLENIETTQIQNKMQNVVNQTSSTYEHLVLTAAGSWLIRQVDANNLRQLHTGLMCIEGFGGPSPNTVIESVRSKLPNNTQLQNLILNAEENNSVSKSHSIAECAKVLINS